jgi:hypothetical protein
MNKDGVIAAVGREPDDSFGRLNPLGELTGRMLYWEEGEVCLFVDFDLNGEAEAAEFHGGGPSLWERVRDWWPW